MRDIEASELVGEVLTAIDADPEENRILLTTKSGKQYVFEHDQKCCESVRIEGLDGEWSTLIGKPLLLVQNDAVDHGEPPPEYPESWTRTTLTFRVDGATVISRWIGESNGYYSEDVTLKEITAGRVST